MKSFVAATRDCHSDPPAVGPVDPTAEAAVCYVALSVRERGHASEAELNAVKAAGYDYAQLIEIVQHVALNTWTNAGIRRHPGGVLRARPDPQ